METSEQFIAKIGAMIPAAMLSSGISVGNELKLFDLIIDNNEPMTSTQIADKGNYKERYVREWLYLMVSGKIVDLANEVADDKKDEQTFTIPEHRRGALHSTLPGPDIGLLQDVTPILTRVKDDLIECFSKDGPKGIGYDKYTGFQEWRDSLNKKRNLIEEVLENLKSMEGMIERLEKGIDVLEVGCSTGVSTIAIARHFPNSRFHGFDISQDAIAIAKEANSLENLQFTVDDACAMPQQWTTRYSLVLCWDVIHDIPRSADALNEISRILAPGGRISVVEPALSSYVRNNIDKPGASFLYGASLFHCMPVSLYYPGGMGLGAAWGRELAEKMFDDAGLKTLSVRLIQRCHQNHFALTHK